MLVAGRNPRRYRLYLFALDVFEDVALENTRASEKSIFRIGHALAIHKPLFNKRNSADQICYLKQLVALLLNVLRKLHAASYVVRKCLVQKVRHVGMTSSKKRRRRELLLATYARSVSPLPDDPSVRKEHKHFTKFSA